MATGSTHGRSIRDRNVGDSAGIRPFKLDVAYATTAAFLIAKSASGENSASAEEGDWFYDSTANVLKLYDGTAWRFLQNNDAAMTAGQIIVANSSAVPTATTLTGDVTVTSAGVTAIGATKVTQAMIATNVLTGTVMANVADSNVIGGALLLFRVKTAGGATASVTLTMTHKVRVIDAWVVNAAAGTASDTITIKNNATAISDIMDINKSDKVVTRAGTIDDAQWEIAAAGTLVITETDGGGSDSPAVDVYIKAIRVA